MAAMFTQRHYEALARAFRDATHNTIDEEETGIAFAAGQVANMLQDDNPRFDRERFYAAIFHPERQV